MLAIEKCREILGEVGKDLSDQRVEELRDSLYKLAHLTLDDYFDSLNKVNNSDERGGVNLLELGKEVIIKQI